MISLTSVVEELLTDGEVTDNGTSIVSRRYTCKATQRTPWWMIFIRFLVQIGGGGELSMEADEWVGTRDNPRKMREKFIREWIAYPIGSRHVHEVLSQASPQVLSYL
jgi:hypothetical protein